MNLKLLTTMLGLSENDVAKYVQEAQDAATSIKIFSARVEEIHENIMMLHVKINALQAQIKERG